MLGLISTGKAAGVGDLDGYSGSKFGLLELHIYRHFFYEHHQSEVSERTRFQIGGAFVYKTVSIRSSTNGTLSCIAIDVPAGTINDGC